MTNTNENQVTVKQADTLTTLNDFENYLAQLGLPNEGIIASESERALMQTNLPLAINSLEPELKTNATYLSKFVASSAIGLYDAGLNYLWNEVVISLRQKVSVYGLDLFFDAAIGGSVRVNYKTEEDLLLVKDSILIDACRKLEIITDVLHEKLKHILFMRNHIGASHPTKENIKTFELLGWLVTCINDVIADTPSEGAIFIKKLITNIKNEELVIENNRIEHIKEVLSKQNTRITGNLLLTLFGIFTKKDTLPVVRGNILKLAPVVWELSQENKKYELGFKIDQFGINLEEDSVALGETFLEKCNGLNYKTVTSKTLELNEQLNELLSTHYAWDNFHYEVAHARKIKRYILTESDIIPNIEDKLIKCILVCRIGNGVSYNEGVSPGAKPYYDEIIKLFNTKHIQKLLRFVNESDVRNNLTNTTSAKQLVALLNLINLDLVEDRTAETIEYIMENIIDKGPSIFKTKELKSYFDTLKI